MLQPVEIEPRRFCRDAQSWETRSDVSALPRLVREFTQGELFCRVSGRVDQRGGLALHLAIQGEVELMCQRCLGGMPYRSEAGFSHLTDVTWPRSAATLSITASARAWNPDLSGGKDITQSAGNGSP